jgi:hypothetical protein
MRKSISCLLLLSLAGLLSGQIVIRDAETDIEFTSRDSVRVTVRQSVTNRSKIIEYFDEESRTVKTRRVSLSNLRNCGYSTFYYSETNGIRLTAMPGCVDYESQSENPRIAISVDIEAEGYENAHLYLSRGLHEPEPVLYTHNFYNPLNKPNVIYLLKLKGNSNSR